MRAGLGRRPLAIMVQRKAVLTLSARPMAAIVGLGRGTVATAFFILAVLLAVIVSV